MAVPLYDLSVAPFIQTLGSMRRVFAKALTHFQATGVDADALVGARLIEDMRPLSFQVQSIINHSLGAIAAIEAGIFSVTAPNLEGRPYAELQAALADCEAGLKALTPERVNALQGRDVVLAPGDVRWEFLAEHYLITLALPNAYFHAATAYDILRMNGAPIGKRDFLGAMRFKQ